MFSWGLIIGVNRLFTHLSRDTERRGAFPSPRLLLPLTADPERVVAERIHPCLRHAFHLVLNVPNDEEGEDDFKGETHKVFPFCVRQDLGRKRGGRGEEEGRVVTPALARSNDTAHSAQHTAHSTQRTAHSACCSSLLFSLFSLFEL